MELNRSRGRLAAESYLSTDRPVAGASNTLPGVAVQKLMDANGGCQSAGRLARYGGVAAFAVIPDASGKGSRRIGCGTTISASMKPGAIAPIIIRPRLRTIGAATGDPLIREFVQGRRQN